MGVVTRFFFPCAYQENCYLVVGYFSLFLPAAVSTSAYHNARVPSTKYLLRQQSFEGVRESVDTSFSCPIDRLAVCSVLSIESSSSCRCSRLSGVHPPPPLPSPLSQYHKPQAAKKLAQKRPAHPRSPPRPRPSPPPNLRHRASLRCPPRLAQPQGAGSDPTSFQPRTRDLGPVGNGGTKATVSAPASRETTGSDVAGRVHGAGEGARPRGLEGGVSGGRGRAVFVGNGHSRGGSSGRGRNAGGMEPLYAQQVSGWVGQRRGVSCGADGRRYKRSLDDHAGGAAEARMADGREARLPRGQEVAPRREVPAGVEIVEVRT